MIKNFLMVSALLLAIVGCSKRADKWELVIHARKGQIENTRLVFDDVDQHVLIFTTGEPRKVSALPLKTLVSRWDKLFASSEPNATLTIRTAEGEQKQLVVILKKPQLLDGQLIFTVDQLGDGFTGSFQSAVMFQDAVLFIDYINAQGGYGGCVYVGDDKYNCDFGAK